MRFIYRCLGCGARAAVSCTATFEVTGAEALDHCRCRGELTAREDARPSPPFNAPGPPNEPLYPVGALRT